MGATLREHTLKDYFRIKYKGLYKRKFKSLLLKLRPAKIEKSRKEKIKDLIEWLVMPAILINAVVMFLQESGFDNIYTRSIDAACIIFFIIEMIYKVHASGWPIYWHSGWNRFDFFLVMISIPALLSYVLPVGLGFLSSVLVLRILRIMRFFRLLDLFSGVDQLVEKLWRALKGSLPVFFTFLVLILFFALVSCSLFGAEAPKYFGTPLDAIYSTFRMCTTEGWYDIPDSVAFNMTRGMIIWVRVYFIFIVVAGGILGLSIVNSIFVDAMVSDNNDDLQVEVKKLREEIEQLSNRIK